MSDKRPRRHKDDDEPVSLAPLTAEQALGGLLRVQTQEPKRGNKPETEKPKQKKPGSQ